MHKGLTSIISDNCTEFHTRRVGLQPKLALVQHEDLTLFGKASRNTAR